MRSEKGIDEKLESHIYEKKDLRKLVSAVKSSNMALDEKKALLHILREWVDEYCVWDLHLDYDEYEMGDEGG